MFNPGDKVVVVNDTDSNGMIKIGEVYTVFTSDRKYTNLVGLGVWYTDRFQLTHENVEKLLTEYYEGQG